MGLRKCPHSQAPPLHWDHVTHLSLENQKMDIIFHFPLHKSPCPMSAKQWMRIICVETWKEDIWINKLESGLPPWDVAVLTFTVCLYFVGNVWQRCLDLPFIPCLHNFFCNLKFLKINPHRNVFFAWNLSKYIYSLYFSTNLRDFTVPASQVWEFAAFPLHNLLMLNVTWGFYNWLNKTNIVKVWLVSFV